MKTTTPADCCNELYQANEKWYYCRMPPHDDSVGHYCPAQKEGK